MTRRPKRQPPREGRGRAPGESRLRRAVDLLSAELGDRLTVHGDPTSRDRLGEERVRLELILPVAPDPQDLAEAAEALEQQLRSAVGARSARFEVVKLGRVFCLRCSSTECEHSAPASPREVFAGYGPSGMPRFIAFDQYLLEGRDPAVHWLHERPPRRVASVADRAALEGLLLEAFRDRERGFRLLGQVASGWFLIPGHDGGERELAVCFQVIGVARKGQPIRLALNLVGSGPDQEPLDAITWGVEVPWQAAVGWVRRALADLERSLNRRRNPEPELERRLSGILAGLARRLLKEERSRKRRTRHAEERRQGGKRPIDRALADLAAAADDRMMVDLREGTVVVLGGRGRAHVFSPEGRLVTSLRLEPGAVKRRIRTGKWRPAEAPEAEALRRTMAGLSTRGAGAGEQVS